LSARSVNVPLSFSHRAGFLPSYIAFLRRHVVPLQNPYFLFFLRRFVRQPRPQNPTGSVLTTSLVLVGLTISRLIPAPRETPHALRVSVLPAYQRKRRYWLYDLTPCIPYLVAFAVRPEISRLGPLLSRISRGRLVSAAAGAAATLVARGWPSSPLPQPRSSSALRRLDRTPPYRAGSGIPRPLAGLDLSPLFPLCCLRVLLVFAVSC